ncbi:MAG: DUF4838 domain-containing protein [Bacteroidaceae bacterium]|nr:DUF4838 domain-containing protein [Bacteroidaceae bacterium]
MPEKPSSNVYAKIGGGVNRDQFCFTSDALFMYIKKYIGKNFDNKKTIRFAILPNDNNVVCLCKRCVECGNTKSDASGAVYFMLERLTSEFPNHIFFTSYYRTASSLPTHPLPENAGVLVSAIRFPLSTCQTPEEEEFQNLLKQWSGYTKRIYVWDYINNFDDYFTPFPVFDIFQHRLRLYEQAGVKGIFMNGSGIEYSTFYRLKMHILALLLSNPETEWRPLLREFCRERYPVTGDVICDFVIKQEDMVSRLGESLELYEGMPAAKRTYLPAEEFAAFHDKLLSLIPQTQGREHKSMLKISKALAFTRLELKRLSGDVKSCDPLLNDLLNFREEGITSYSESGGTIENYVNDYRYMLRRAAETKGKNLLKGVQLEPITALDEDYNDISILTDGLLGLPSCYHCGQMLSSATPALRIAIPHVQGMKRLRVNMTKNPIFHISLPLRVTLTAGGHEIGSVVPTPTSSSLQRATAEFKIPDSYKGKLVLNIYRDQEDRTMALDEIEGFE